MPSVSSTTAKGCPKHGHKHRLKTSYSLCCHPECLEYLIYSKASKRAVGEINYLKLMGEFEDWLSFYVERLLKAKQPVVSRANIGWALRDWSKAKEAKKVFPPELLLALEDEVEKQASSFGQQSDAYKIVLCIEVFNHIVNVHGEHWALYLGDCITRWDMMKLMGSVTLSAEEVRREVREWAGRQSHGH